MHTTMQGQGKPLLLVHGIGSTSRGWQPVMPTLAKDRRIIAIDCPATAARPRGKTAAPSPGFWRACRNPLPSSG